MKDNTELLSASDEQIDDALQYASPMVLRGLLYQLTGDADLIAMAPGPAAKFGVGREMAEDADAELIKTKGAAFLKQSANGTSIAGVACGTLGVFPNCSASSWRPGVAAGLGVEWGFARRTPVPPSNISTDRSACVPDAAPPAITMLLNANWQTV